MKALKRNLFAHAEHNPSIIADGTSKAELEERLKQILEAREKDLIVRDVLWKGEDRGEDGEEGQDGEEEDMDATMVLDEDELDEGE